MGVTRYLAVLGVVCAAAGHAAADGLDAERFVPAVSAEGGFVQEHPMVPYHFGWGIGLFLNLADDPVVEKTSTGDDLRKVIDTAVSTDLVASIGLWRRLELGLHLPIHLYYDGDPFAYGAGTLEASAGIGDLRFVPKVQLLSTGDLAQHFLLGFALPLSFPTGDEEALRGSGGVAVHPRLLFAAHLGKI